MKTLYDWVTIAIFAGLIVLFMQRSTRDDGPPDDALWMYLVAGVGCAIANYVGNESMHVPAVLVLVATIAFIFHFLKPFAGRNPH